MAQETDSEKIARLERENQELRAEVERLRRALEEALRAAKRQAAPFSRRHPQAHSQTPDRQGVMRLYPVVVNGVTGIVRSEFVPSEKGTSFSLADRGHKPYPVFDPNDSSIQLTVCERDSTCDRLWLLPIAHFIRARCIYIGNGEGQDKVGKSRRWVFQFRPEFLKGVT